MPDADLKLDADHNLAVEDGDLALLSGLDALHANLMDLLLSSRGSLLHHLAYGGNAQDMVAELPDDESLLQFAAECKRQILTHPDVKSVERCEATRVGDMTQVSSFGIVSPDDQSLDGVDVLLTVDLTTISGLSVENLSFPFVAPS